MIEVRHLKLIDTVAKVGSLSKAAEKLCLTQSALSHQLKDLESRLEVQIFHRHNNKLLFTPEGKELRDASSDLLDQFETLENRVRDISQNQLNKYVHGYSDSESQRLNDQANTMTDLLHYDSSWPEGSKVLEVGCGVGSQTQIICKRNPKVEFTSVDLSEKSLVQANQVANKLGLENASFQQADVYKLPFATGSFDHVFVCFLLEHLENPLQGLSEMQRVLKKGGTITVIEGDHGSTYFYPDSEMAQKAVRTQVELQKQNGGNANIGRTLYPLLTKAGFEDVRSSPRQVYVDASKPDMVEGFMKNTFTAMIEGVKEEAIAEGLTSEQEMSKGIQDLLLTAKGGTFCYTFFKALGVKKSK